MLRKIHKISKGQKVLVFLVLFFLNIGLKSLFPDEADNNWSIYVVFFCMLASFGALGISRSIAGRNYQKLFVLAFIFYLYLFTSSLLGDTQYGLAKACLGLLVPFTLATFFGRYEWTEDEIFRYITYAVGIICLVAIIYKLRTGFFDRQQNYGLLGPIPFGWVSGMAFLSVVLRKERYFFHLFGAIFFFLMIIWSGSKGPFIAVLALSVLRFNRILGDKIIVKIFVCVLLIIGIYLVFTYGQNSRIVTSIQAYVQDPEGFSKGLGKGSVGQRQENYSRAINLFFQNPIVGVGFGGWASGAYYQEKYPHNILFELASETGLIGIFLFIFFIFKLNKKNTIMWIGYFGLLALMFSGDFSYLRYSLYPILMGSFVKTASDGIGNGGLRPIKKRLFQSG
ncbi:O-antigen ligase [Mucilaginibacter sp. L3T2-6]|uniref:O-antigen ligase family protein n=1 Tax=Mucilaginibacter sp. L3T2-6 TaxID=3062491 RepID=UPI002676DE80|nr:O-antigen ligase family protein [Mucilaginibacter sp. L3T2-6]MDO3642991.1 O-antigen ligase family protein [Mucilaginibacter sp. L3T2-6]MDV6215316.1 O-antigen ligase family protein [Mucilaginibacter sp. L3T2-6]